MARGLLSGCTCVCMCVQYMVFGFQLLGSGRRDYHYTYTKEYLALIYALSGDTVMNVSYINIIHSFVMFVVHALSGDTVRVRVRVRAIQ